MKKCKNCKNEFEPSRPLQSACSPSCAYKIVLKKREIKNKKLLIADTKKRKAALKTKSDYTKDAQIVCNKYIRLRDISEPCISCGLYDHEIKHTYTGGKWDAGHFKTRGAYPELRFNENNIHKQCKKCNGGSGKWAKKGRDVAAEYRINLIKKIGVDIVKWLECDQKIQKLTIEDLKEIKIYYKEKIKLINIDNNLN